MSFLAARCPRCMTVQSPAPKCRRCERALPKPIAVADSIPVAPPLFPEVLPTLDRLEQQLIEEAMRRAEGSGMKAAAMIGMGKTTLYRKLKEYAAKEAA